MITETAKQHGADPDIITETAKQRGTGPDMITETAKQHGADPDMITGPVKKPAADPNMVTDPARKPGAAPNLIDGPAKKPAAAPSMITEPAKKRSADADMIPGRGPDAPASAQQAPGNASPGGKVARRKRREVPPQDVIKSFVDEFVGEMDRAGVNMSVEQRRSMTVAISCPAWDLTVTFMSREKPFDSVVVKRLNGQADESEQPQASGFLAKAKAILGPKAGKGAAAGEASERTQQWVAPVKDFRTRAFRWKEGVSAPAGSPGADEKVALVAELFDRGDQRRWLIELIDSKQAAGDQPAVDFELSSAGIRCLLAPLLGGLHSAIKNGIQSS